MTTPTAAPGTRTADIELTEVKMHLYRPGEPVVARVHKTEICTGRKASGIVRHLEFDVSGTMLEGVCVPGQSIGVLPPGMDERGRPHQVRLYSLASPTGGEDGQGRIISTTVKRTIEEHWETHKLFLGVASNYLCDLQAGDEVRLSGPNGKRFVLPRDPSGYEYVFFATGTGIAPYRGMLMDLFARGIPGRVVLVMGAPYSTDLIYHDQFLRLAEQHSNFTYLTALSREKQDDVADRLYVQDRIRTERERLLPVLTGDRTLLYICGIAGMELGILQELALQLPEEARARYLDADAAALHDVRSWTRAMLHKQVRPTRRVFLEVYA